jgi:hypothetical protein
MEYSETYKVFLNEKYAQKFIKYMERYHKEFQMFNPQPNGEYIITFYDERSIRLQQRTDRCIKYTHRKRIMCVMC